MNEIKELLKKVTGAYGPSGHESLGAAACLRECAAPYVDTIETDTMGNLICTKHGSELLPKVLLMAHMDQIGLMVTEITDSGFLRVTPVGGIRPHMLFYRPVVFADGTQGVISHETGGGRKEGELLTEHFYVDIGAESKEDAEKKVSIGDVCVYTTPLMELGENRLASQAMDDRSGCAIVLEVLRRVAGTDANVCAVFSAQEEVGLRGATTAAYGQSPDFAIAVDVCPTGDTPNAAPLAVTMGKGAAIKVMDGYSISHLGLRKCLEAAAKAHGIPYQMEILKQGGTDSAAIQKSRSGVASATISLPSRYVHSACEVIDLRDFEAAVSLIAAAITESKSIAAKIRAN